MSQYPKPNTSDIFNPIDYTQNSPNTNTSTEEIDTTNLVKRSGDTMTGILTVPVIKFTDNTQQTSAYDHTGMDQFKSDTSNNTYKLENVSHINDFTFISNLKVDDIQFMNAKQNQAFLDVDKTQIYINSGQISSQATDITDLQTITANLRLNTTSLVLIDNTLSLKNSETKTIVNTIGPYTLLDGNMALMRGSSVYRKYWLGMTGNNVDAADNRFNICVNGNHTVPECILDLDHDGNLIIKGNMSCSNISSQTTTYNDGVQINAFTTSHKAKIESLESDTSDITQNTNDISQNTSDITQNTSDITQNTSDITQNTSDITQNTSAIHVNTAHISNHASDILSLENSTQFSLLTQEWKDELRKQSTIFEVTPCYCDDVFGTNAGQSFPLNSTIISHTELDMSTLVSSLFYNGGFADPRGFKPPALMHMKFELNLDIADGYVKKCVSQIYVKDDTGSTVAHSLLQGVEYNVYTNENIRYSCDLHSYLQYGHTVTVSTYCDIVSYATNFEMEGQFSFVQL